MKILHLIYDDMKNPWLGGGGAFQTHTINKYLVQRGHKVTIVTGNYPGAKNEEIIDGIRYLRIGSHKTYILSRITYSIFVHRYIKELKYDLLVVDFSAYTPTISMLFTKKPVIAVIRNYFGIHTFRKYKLLGILGFIYEKFGIKLYHNFIANSLHIYEQIQKSTSNKRIKVINNCVEKDLFSLDSKDENYIFFLGRIDIYHKGLDTLLKAFRVVSMQKKIELIIGGGGKDLEKLKLIISEYGLRDLVRLEGRVYGEKKIQLLKNCLFMVMPSRFESFGNVAIEAAACSKPIIGTSIPGLRDTVKDGSTGLLIEADQPETLANAMLRLIGDKALRARLGQAGREWAMNFNVEQSVTKFEDYYLECLESHKGR